MNCKDCKNFAPTSKGFGVCGPLDDATRIMNGWVVVASSSVSVEVAEDFGCKHFLDRRPAKPHKPVFPVATPPSPNAPTGH